MSVLNEPLLIFGLEEEEEKKDLLSFYWFKNGFSKDDCEQIKEQAKAFSQVKATTFADGKEDPNRNSTVRWIDPTADTRWIFETIQNFVNEANKELFHLSVTGFTESIQFTEYEGKGTQYGWHIDIGPGKNKRKISVVVQLSDPADYKGGNLILNTGNEISTDREQGSVILFPSILLHKVEPLISGNRYSLVSWVSGAVWR
jgi:PKHD-type hydroxylase